MPAPNNCPDRVTCKVEVVPPADTSPAHVPSFAAPPTTYHTASCPKLGDTYLVLDTFSPGPTTTSPI